MKAKFATWLRQPSTIVGIGSLIGIATGCVTHLLTHDTTASVALGGAVASLVHIVMPDNSGAATAAQTLTQDVVTAAVQKRLRDSLPALIADVNAMLNAAVVQQLVPTPAPVPVAPAPAPLPAPAPAPAPVAPAAPVAVPMQQVPAAVLVPVPAVPA